MNRHTAEEVRMLRALLVQWAQGSAVPMRYLGYCTVTAEEAEQGILSGHLYSIHRDPNSYMGTVQEWTEAAGDTFTLIFPEE